MSKIADPRRVEVTYLDSKEYRGSLEDIDADVPERKVWGLLTHRTDTSIVLVHDTDDVQGDVYASVIPLAAVKACHYMETL